MPDVRKTKSFGMLAGIALLVALFAAPLVATSATAAEPLVGEVGVLTPADSEANSPEYWEDEFQHAATCFKAEGDDKSGHGSVTDDGLTVTLSEYGDDWTGDHWEALIIKAGNTSNVIWHPEAGIAYASPANDSGNQAMVSHWIVCKGTTPVQPEEREPKVEHDVTTTFICEDDVAKVTTTTTTTTPYVRNTQTGEWELGTPVISAPVVAERPLTTEEKLQCPTETTIETTDWEDGIWQCGDTTVEQTREVTTTPVDAKGEPIGEPTVVTETRTRSLTQDEIAECPLVPGGIESVCVGDVPYLGYAVSLPEGYQADSETPVEIVFVNPDGDDYVVENQPLEGELLWPGASAAEPKMWPGWALQNGEYVETDGNYAWTRDGVTVEFHVNPSYSTVVEYPEATALCANPPVGGGEPGPVSTPTAAPTPAAADGELAATGGDVNPVVPIAGGAALVLGIAAMAFAAYRRRISS